MKAKKDRLRSVFHLLSPQQINNITGEITSRLHSDLLSSTPSCALQMQKRALWHRQLSALLSSSVRRLAPRPPYFVRVQRRTGHMVGFRKRSVTCSFKQTWFPVSWMKVVCVCVTFTQVWPPTLLALPASGKDVVLHHLLHPSESEYTFWAGHSVLKVITPDKVFFLLSPCHF